MNVKDTLNLPKTDFPIRPNHLLEDAIMIKRWEEEKLSQKTFSAHTGSPSFILHDGPPYANGHIHLGHAYNKILKDIITKSRRMQGMHVPVTPGWDCHGLPIELKVTQELASAELSPIQIKKACRTYAAAWIEIQKEEFKKLGIMMDWDRNYSTMAPDYEASILEALSIFIEKGAVTRKNKTVAWCYSCKTTLATAEIEYQDRKDPSLYVRFPLDADMVTTLFPHLAETIVSRQVSILVWTTTPWTLPLNRAVMFHPHAMYQLIDIDGHLIILGEQIAPQVAYITKKLYNALASFPSKLFMGHYAQHPFIENLRVPFVADDSVGLYDGTAFVHTAPGAGPIDYEVGVKNKLEIYSPVDASGRYTSDVKPVDLSGMSIVDGQGWVIKRCAEVGTLFYKASVIHSYPHCWRCHNGLIFRATPQWFVDLTQHDIKKETLASIDTIDFVPERAQKFLKATIEHRWEWCISRQRIWGVPIPALICVTCDTVVTSADFVRIIAHRVRQSGIEYWDTVSVDELTSLVDVCLGCHKKQFNKEKDILDVWFDSGISHYAVLEKNPDLGFPADVYSEGVDQHRGWFQSSLLTSVVIEGRACMRRIISHGYTVDEKGRKMSKSLGNVIAPDDIVKQYGTDVVRLWVSSIGNDGDLVVSPGVLANVAEVYRKIRNTCRFLLQNIADFNPQADTVYCEHLLAVDRHALGKLHAVNRQLLAYYQDYNLTGVFHLLADYCSQELSSFYLDIIKDRLYVERANSLKRRSAQTVVWHILDTLTRTMAPILSFTSEQVSDAYQHDKKESIHLQTFMSLEEYKQSPEDGLLWEFLTSLRSAIFKSIEGQREQGIIKHSLEAAVTIFIDQRYYEEYPLLKSLVTSDRFLSELFIVSEVMLHKSTDNLTQSALKGIFVATHKAQGAKCQRCWHWQRVVDTTLGSETVGLCSRCREVLLLS